MAVLAQAAATAGMQQRPSRRCTRSSAVRSRPFQPLLHLSQCNVFFLPCLRQSAQRKLQKPAGLTSSSSCCSQCSKLTASTCAIYAAVQRVQRRMCRQVCTVQCRHRCTSVTAVRQLQLCTELPPQSLLRPLRAEARYYDSCGYYFHAR